MEKRYRLVLILMLFIASRSVATTLQQIDSLLAVYEESSVGRQQTASEILSLTASDAVFFDVQPQLRDGMSVEETDLIVLYSIERWMTTCSYFSEALRIILRALPLADKSGNDVLVATMLCDRAYCLYKTSDYTTAIEVAQQAVQFSQEINNDMQLSRAYLYLCLVNYGLRNYDEAVRLIERSIEINDNLGVNIQTHNTYGVACEIYCGAGQVEKAVEYGQKAVEAAQAVDYLPGVANHLTQLSYAYDRLGDYEQGLASANEAIRIVRGIEPLDRNQLAISLEFKGWNLIDMKRNQEAVEALREAIKLEEEVGNAQAVCYDYRTLYEALEPLDARESLAALRRYTVMADSLHFLQLKELMSKADAELHNDELQQQNEQNRVRMRYIMFGSVALVLLLSIIIISLIYAFRQKRRSAEALKLLTETREAFFTNVTHEFRTPLTVILGLGNELQKKDMEPQKQREAGAMIVRQGESLLNLVNQMLDISKVRSAIGEQSACRGNLSAYIAMIIETYQEMARQRGVIIDYETEANGIDTVFVADYVDKVVGNLLNNAVKFTGDGGQVNVSLRLAGNMIEFVVKDTGCGISESDIPHIFEPFYRADNAEGTGSGVGLALVKQIIDAIGGTIEVESRLGKGTIFTVRVKNNKDYASHSSAVTEWSVKPSEIQISDNKQNYDPIVGDADSDISILIVEDNADVSHFIGSLLADKYQLHFASDGEQGLSLAQELLPDVIITDLMMPHTDGLSLCRAIRADVETDHIPIIVITAKASEEDRLRGLKAGADSYLTKPFNSEELLICIENILSGRERLKRRYSLTNQLTEQGLISDLSVSRDDAVEQGIGGSESASTLSASAFMYKVDEIIGRLIPNNCTVEMLAKEMYMSQRTLQRKMIVITGVSPKRYIMDARFKLACKMIDDYPDRTIEDIATTCGFHDASHFIHTYQSVFGVSPRKRNSTN